MLNKKKYVGTAKTLPLSFTPRRWPKASSPMERQAHEAGEGWRFPGGVWGAVCWK